MYKLTFVKVTNGEFVKEKYPIAARAGLRLESYEIYSLSAGERKVLFLIPVYYNRTEPILVCSDDGHVNQVVDVSGLSLDHPSIAEGKIYFPYGRFTLDPQGNIEKDANLRVYNSNGTCWAIVKFIGKKMRIDVHNKKGLLMTHLFEMEGFCNIAQKK